MVCRIRRLTIAVRAVSPVDRLEPTAEGLRDGVARDDLPSADVRTASPPG